MVSCMKRWADWRTPGLAVLGAVALALVGGNAEASTVVGRITGTPIPAAGKGQAFVFAANLQTSEVVGADDADAAGRYRLTVPKGAFALFPSVITLGHVISPKPTKVRLRGGQRRSVGLPARAKAVILRPIVALPDNSFKGGTGQFSVLNRGLRDMLISDLASVRTAGCDVTLVERSAAFMAARNAELALVRRGLVDPATAIRPGRLINPTRGIRGTISVTGGRMRINAEIYRWSSQKTLYRTSVEGPAARFFQLEPQLARQLAKLLCGPPPPVSGTFSGSLDYSRQTPVGTVLGRLDWNGSLELEPQQTQGIPPQFGGPTASYGVRSGTFTARLDISSVFDGCTISGQGTFDVVAVRAGSTVPVLTITEGNPDTYRLVLDGTLAKIPVLSVCPPPGTSGPGEWPLLGIGLLPFSQTPAITTEGVFAGSATGSTPGVDDGYKWTWSLSG